jgi:hypothetical protein
MLEDVMRTPVLQHTRHTVNHDTVKSQSTDSRCRFLAVNKFGIPENAGMNSKMFQDLALMLRYLKFEFIARKQARQGVIVGLRQEIDGTCFSKTPEAIQNLRSKFFKLIDCDAGNRKRDFNARVFTDEFKEQSISGKVAICRDALYDLFVQVIIKVIFV